MDSATIDLCRQLAGPARPTFCNVPEWAQLLLYLSGLVAIALFAHGIFRHWRVWLDGQTAVPSRNTGRVRTRVGFFFRYVVAQQATTRRRLPAIFHSSFFYGFVLLFIGTVLATLDWDVAKLLLGGQFLTGGLYLAYEFVLDTAGLVFIVGLLIAIWRRYITAAHHVAGDWDFVLWSLLIISVSGFLLEGLRLVLGPVPWGGYSWVGQGIANMLFGLPPAVLQQAVPAAHLWLWLFHAGVSLLFIAAIPFTNAVHMFTTSANAVLRSVEPVLPGAALQPIDIEKAEFFGVSKLSELTWKQRLGVDSCLRCGRCETVCPAYMSGTPLNPKQIIVSLSEALREELDRPIMVADDGGVIVGDGLLVDPAALWSCTTCMACVEVCPAFIEIVDDIVDMRRFLTLSEGALPGTAPATLKNMDTTGNPWGYSPEERTKWSDGLDVPLATPGEHYEVLYWVGCSASYDKRNQKIAQSIVRLLKAANVNFAVMREERCNCESARRMGEEYLYQTATEANVGSMKQFSFDRVLAHCPHCFNTIKNEYPQFGGDFEVVHHTQLIQELVAKGRLRLPAAPGATGAGGQAALRVAFHDSCYLGRYNGEFEAPRDTLRAAGVALAELPRRRQNGLCCGGGGGKMWFESAAVKEVNLIRLEEALAEKPDVVGVACPFCLTMLDSAKRSMGVEDVEILDVSEVLARRLG